MTEPSPNYRSFNSDDEVIVLEGILFGRLSRLFIRKVFEYYGYRVIKMENPITLKETKIKLAFKKTSEIHFSNPDLDLGLYINLDFLIGASKNSLYSFSFNKLDGMSRPKLELRFVTLDNYVHRDNVNFISIPMTPDGQNLLMYFFEILPETIDITVGSEFPSEDPIIEEEPIEEDPLIEGVPDDEENPI